MCPIQPSRHDIHFVDSMCSPFCQAFDNRRPAALLLEDSIRLFQTIELRSLPEAWDATLFGEKYSLPLRSWDITSAKRKKEKTSRKNEVTPTPARSVPRQGYFSPIFQVVNIALEKENVTTPTRV